MAKTGNVNDHDHLFGRGVNGVLGHHKDVPDLTQKSYADKYDIMDNSKVKLDRPVVQRGGKDQY